MDIRQKALASFTLLGMVLAFAYFNEILAVFVALAALPFFVGVLRR